MGFEAGKDQEHHQARNVIASKVQLNYPAIEEHLKVPKNIEAIEGEA